ncbi:MAG: rhomboid family intramembrane serine protease [Pirellulaceae bacterium]|jgi:GlpG protein|nr:rhomboid family intramembrane serine protease [Pirellulaceae bacterium]MDP7017796.1 rhomboid family intramembrane serine protease [Pirellulaceae bacterium]
MRRLGELAEDDAKRFAQFLREQEIAVEARRESDGWTVWVYDENDVVAARAELERFRGEPEHERYPREAAPEDLVEEVELARDGEQPVNLPFSPPRRTKYVWTLILLTLAVTTWGGCDLESTVGEQLAFCNPIKYDLSTTKNVLSDIQVGQVWRLITPIFLDLSYLLIPNMIFLYRLGGQIETRQGPLVLALLIVVIGVLSNTAQALGPEQAALPSLSGSPKFGGMSGVVCGLFGYVLVRAALTPRWGFWIDRFTAVLIVSCLVACFIPNQEFQSALQIANLSLLIGFLTGGAAGVLMSRRG